MAGFAKWEDVYREDLGLEYFFDLNEIMAVKNENEHRAYESIKKDK
jgi:hypothetical protein